LDDRVEMKSMRAHTGRDSPQFSDFWRKHPAVTISTPKGRPGLRDFRDAPPRLGIDRVSREANLAQAARQAGWNPRPGYLEGASAPVNETDALGRLRDVYGRA